MIKTTSSDVSSEGFCFVTVRTTTQLRLALDVCSVQPSTVFPVYAAFVRLQMNLTVSPTLTAVKAGRWTEWKKSSNRIKFRMIVCSLTGWWTLPNFFLSVLKLITSYKKPSVSISSPRCLQITLQTCVISVLAGWSQGDCTAFNEVGRPQLWCLKPDGPWCNRMGPDGTWWNLMEPDGGKMWMFCVLHLKWRHKSGKGKV